MRSLIRCQGGKKRQADFLLGFFSAGRSLFEPFVGGGAIYLAWRAAGAREHAVLNDLNPGVAAMWRVLHSQVRLDARLRDLAARPSTNEEFLARAAVVPSQDDVELATEWLWLQNGSFSGKPVWSGESRWFHAGCGLDGDRSYREREARRRGVDPDGPVSGTSRRDFGVIAKRACALQERLRSLSTEVYCGDYSVVPEPERAVTYADPPYDGTTGYGRESWDQGRFASWLGELKGGIVVSGFGSVTYEGFVRHLVTAGGGQSLGRIRRQEYVSVRGERRSHG